MTDEEQEIDEADSFVAEYTRSRLLDGTRRRGLVALWVRARLQGKTDVEAREAALVGMPIWAGILAHVIFKLLLRWWENRTKHNGVS